MVRESRRISRIEIANRTRLSKATVSEIAGRLVESGFILPVGQGPAGSRGGRKRELLEFNPDAACVFGVDIERTRTDVAVTNLDATILRRASFSYPTGTPPDQVLAKLVAALRSLDAHVSGMDQKAVGIGIGLPGVIDRGSGLIKVADTLRGWEGFDLAAGLRKEFDLPVFIENDVKARTFGELIFGAGRSARDAVYLWHGDGVGAGLVINGHLHHGFTSSAGEVGYSNVAPLGDHFATVLRERGQRDLGDLLSETNIRHALGTPSSSSGNLAADLMSRVARGDERAERVLHEVGEVFGSLCITMVNMLNPELIVFGGELFWRSDRLVNEIGKKLRSDILSVPANAVRLTVSNLREDGVLLGSVGHVLFDLFRPTLESAEPVTSEV